MWCWGRKWEPFRDHWFCGSEDSSVTLRQIGSVWVAEHRVYSSQVPILRPQQGQTPEEALERLLEPPTMVYGVPFYPWPLTGWGGQDFYGGIGPKLYTILTRFGGRWQTGGGWVDTPEEAIQVQVQDDLPETLYECVKLRAERIQPGVTLTRGLTASLKVRRLKAMFGLRHD